MAIKSQNIITKIALFLLFGMLIFSFAIWGIGDIFRSGSQSLYVAEIGDTKVTDQEFSRRLNSELRDLSGRLGTNLTLEQARDLGLVDRVVSQVVTRGLFDETARKHGLMVSDDQIRSVIAENPAFRDDLDRFDRTAFARTLQAFGLTEGQYIEGIKRDITRQHLANAASRGGEAPKVLVDQLFAYQNEKRTADVIRLSNADAEDPGEPSEDALQAFYDENQDRYMAPEYRGITLVQLTTEGLAAEVAVSSEQIAEAFEQRRAEFSTPERRQVFQILYDTQESAEAAMAELKSGRSFESVAEQSSDTGLVDLGNLTREDMIQEMADAAFSLASGEVAGPIESPVGWHLLQVTEITPGKDAVLADVEESIADDIAKRIAVENLVSMANQLDDTLASGATLEEAADSLNLPLDTIAMIDRSGRDPQGEVVSGLPAGRDLLQAVFTLGEGEESLLTETELGDYFIFRVDSVTPPAVKPLADIRPTVILDWQSAQKEEATRKRAEDLLARIKSGENFAELAEAEGLEIIETEPITRLERAPQKVLAPTLPQRLFDMSPGDTAIVDSAGGQLLVRLDEVRSAGEDTTAYEALEGSLENGIRGDLIEQFVAAMRQDIGVTVNDLTIERMISGVQYGSRSGF
jgi:peptidyl-prolyl cis-trans isomerase D